MTFLRSLVPPSVWGAGYRAIVAKNWVTGDLKQLERTAALRDRYRGRRGFVLGNGASLRKLDLRKLRDEHVVTMNASFDHRAVLGIDPVAHVFFDDWYFEQGRDQLRRYQAQRKNELTFVPLTARKVADELLPDASFFLPAGAFEHNHNLDLARAIPYFQTVALPSLLVAMHLGLDPIYLLGCDMDMLCNVVGVSPLRVRVPYFYDNGEPQTETLTYEYAWYAGAVVRMLEGFRFVHDHLPPNKHVYNAGVGGLLEFFPRVEFASLF